MIAIPEQTAAAPRARVLLLVHRVPYPPNRGDRIRSYRLLRFLAERADVSLAYLAEEPTPAETQHALGALCQRVADVRLGRFSRWIHGAWSLVRGGTATEGLFRSGRLRRRLAEWTRTTRFDAVVVFCSSMIQYLDLPGLAGVPVVVDLVDVDSQKWLDYAEQSRGVLRRLYRTEGKRLRRLERTLPSAVRAVALISQSEVDLYRSFCANNSVCAIPNGVDLEYFQPYRESRPTTPQSCVFVGAMDYRANIDGVTWFCNEIWPEIFRRRPGATFTIVGSRPAPAVRRLAEQPGVRVAGDVPDVRPYLADAAVVVVPLRIARGIQNKILEAMAMQKAVIATPQALEGIAIESGVHVRRATTPAEWVETLDGLLDDLPTQKSLGRESRAYVETHHDWASQFQPLADVLGLQEHS